MGKGIQNTLRLGVLLPIAAAGLAFSSTVAAQDDEAIFEEIVVTVQRREQSIMDVPVAVSAISGEQILAAGIRSTAVEVGTLVIETAVDQALGLD